jgi:hypothetical protein
MSRRALAAGLACLALAASAAAGARPAWTRSAGPGTAELLARYEPVLELYGVDRKPSSVESFLAASDLQRLSAGTWHLVRHSPPAAALAHGSKQLRLNVRGCSPAVNLDSCYRRPTGPATLYGRAWISPTASSGIATVLQYWLFYPLDDWRNSLKKPTLWHMHEGDWEEVSVALDTSGRPVQVACSQHDLGVRRAWARVPKRIGGHPVVYVALGSHANYFLPGSGGLAGVPHAIPSRFSGVPLPEPDFTSAQVTVRSAAVVDLSRGSQPWLSFAGAWGDGSYVLVGEGRKYTHLHVGDSPPGPAMHSIWRDPLLQFRSWPVDDGH